CGDESSDENEFKNPPPAPDISGPDQDGKTVSLADYKGKVVVVDFWTSWCGYCPLLVPELKDLQQRYAGRPFALLGSNMGDRMATFGKAVAEEKMTWRVCFDGERGPLYYKYQIGSFPTVVLIDHQGRERYYYGGLPPSSVLDKAVAKLVQEAEKD